MENREILYWFEKETKSKKTIAIPNEIFDSISPELSKDLSRIYGHSILMKLPEYEIEFFEWLKSADKTVWNDLWGESEEEPYIIGMSFLQLLVEKDGRGFPICDLLHSDNYFFSLSHMVDEESKMMLDSTKERFHAKKKLTIAQLLTLEISIGPIDIWHFAYKYKLNLDEAKEAVLQLVEDQVLVHLTEAEHLANFIDF